MAVLDLKLGSGVTNTQVWLHALDNILQAGRSGNDQPLTALGANCYHAERRRYGLPALIFNGEGATGPAMQGIEGGAGGKTVYAVVKFNSIASDEAQVQNNEPLFNSDYSLGRGWGVFMRNVGGAGDYRLFAANYSAGWLATAAITIALNTWYLVIAWHNGTTLRLAVNDYVGNRQDQASGATGYGSAAALLQLGKRWAGAYTSHFELGELIYRRGADTLADVETIQSYMLSEWAIDARGDAVEDARAEGSRQMWALGAIPPAPEIVTESVGLLDLSLGDRLTASGEQWAHRDGSQVDIGDDKRVELAVTGLTLEGGDGKTFLVRASCIDQRLRACMSFVRFDPPDAPSPWNDGALVLLPNSGLLRVDYGGGAAGYTQQRTARRAADGVYTRLYPGWWPLEDDGFRVEDICQPVLIESTFVNGNTGWTRSSGGGGLTPGVVAIGAGDAFDSTVTGYKMRLQQDSPVTRVKSVVPAAALAISSVCTISILISGTSDAAILRLSRAIDGQYYNDTTGLWAAGPIDNALPATTAPTRWVSKLIPAPAAATTYTLTILQAASGTASRINDVGQVQVEVPCYGGSGYGATSPVPTGATLKQRPQVRPFISAVSTDPAVALLRGTLFLAFKPDPGLFARNGAAAFNYCGILRAENGSIEPFNVHYHSATEEFHLQVPGGGASTLAVARAGLVDGYHHWLAIRYSGPTGDEDLAANKVQLVVDGVASALAASTGFDDVADQNVWLGSELDMPMGGWVRAWQAFPRVLSLDECAAWGRRHAK